MEEKKNKKSPIMIIVGVIAVVLIVAAYFFGYHVGENKTEKEKENKAETKDCINENDDKKDDVEKDEKKENGNKKDDVEKDDNLSETNDDSKYSEKVYAYNNNSITLFKSGNCVVIGGLEYTDHCKYTIENNILTVTRKGTGSNMGDEKTYTYNIVDNNGHEYIQSTTDSNESYKLLNDNK